MNLINSMVSHPLAKGFSNAGGTSLGLLRKNVGVLADIAEHGGDPVYVHPESMPKLPERYQLSRSLKTYMEGMPGLDSSLGRSSVYIDAGAGRAVAVSEFAMANPKAKAIAISMRDYPHPKNIANLDYLLGDARKVLLKFREQGLKADTLTDEYGAFTFSPGGQIGLLQLYHDTLEIGGRAFIRFDADHVGVMTRLGAMKLFDGWLDDLQIPNVAIFDGPAPAGPTAHVKVISITGTDETLEEPPKLELVGTHSVPGDAVPFVVYNEL